MDVIGWCKPQLFGYGKAKQQIPVYGYKFVVKDKDGSLGYLAVEKFVHGKSTLKWALKSLHKDQEVLDMIDGFMPGKEAEYESRKK